MPILVIILLLFSSGSFLTNSYKITLLTLYEGIFSFIKSSKLITCSHLIALNSSYVVNNNS
jgi:hypothetical protein